MKYPVFFVLVFALFVLGNLKAQWGGPVYSIAYSGNNLWNPGIQFGMNKTFSANYKVQKNGIKKLVTLGFELDAGYFLDPGIYHALYLNTGLSRKLSEKGKFWRQWAIQPLGILQSGLPNTYEYSGNGTIEEIRFPNRWYYAPSVQFQFGLNHKNKRVQNSFLGVQSMLLMPYNTAVMPLLNVKIGYKFNS